MAIKPVSSFDSAKRLYAINTDNSLAVGAMLSPDVPPSWTGFEPTDTFAYEGVVSLSGVMYILVRRAATQEVSLVVGWPDDDYSLDFRETVVAGKVTNPVLFSTQVFFLGTPSGGSGILAGGYATVDGSGNVTGIPAEYTNVSVGLPVISSFTTSKVPSQDFRGDTISRKQKITKALVSHLQTRQYYIDGEKALLEGENNGPIELPLSDGVGVRYKMGFSRDPKVVVTNMVPYKCTWRSITMEVTS